MLDPALDLMLRGVLALLFASSALHKARDRAGFRAALDDYALLPHALVGLVAAVSTAMEAMLAVAMVAPAWLGVRAPALVGTAALLSLYGAAIAVNLARGRRDIDCGCAGPVAPQTLSGWLVARNALLAALALAGLAGTAARPLVWIDAITVAGGIAWCAATWVAAHGLLAHAAALARLREAS